jgi:hypothetical protein
MPPRRRDGAAEPRRLVEPTAQFGGAAQGFKQPVEPLAVGFGTQTSDVYRLLTVDDGEDKQTYIIREHLRHLVARGVGLGCWPSRSAPRWMRGVYVQREIRARLCRPFSLQGALPLRGGALVGAYGA